MASPLYELTIREAHQHLRQRELSSVELTHACLDRIAEIEPSVRAYVNVTSERAMEQARSADSMLAQGDGAYLTGVPLQVKDVMCTSGVATTCASRMLEHFVPTYNASVVDRLYDQGAVLLGKGNMDEFAMGSSTENSAFHPTHNPWDLAKVPGGSSGGGAAAVAAGEAIYALGSDTGGSVRQPASLCGIVGLKPTYGLVSRYGLIAYASSLDQIGPLTKDVTDCALVLNAIAGHDTKDSTSIPGPRPDYLEGLNGGVEGLRIGVPREYFVEGMQAEVKDAVSVAIETLARLGAEVEEVSLPSTPYALAVYYIIAPSECSANLARYDGVKFGYSYQDAGDVWEAMEKTREYGFGAEVKRRIMLGTYALSAGYYDAYYLKALKVRTLIRRELDEVFGRCDVLVTPTSPTAAFDLGQKTGDPVQMYLSDIFTIPVNIAGIPAVSIPCGMAGGLPVGLQLMGPALSEPTLLRAAYVYEQATDWHKTRPKI